MKNLKNYVKGYINESYLNESVWDINESVWDIENNIDSDNNEFILNEIKKFIEDNYVGINIDHCEFVFDEKKDKYIISYNRRAILKHNSTQLTNDLFEWGVVKDDFDCSQCPNLTSLEGAPKEVGGVFVCCECPKLTSLLGAPKRVSGRFNCSNCDKLTSLKGAPEVVYGSFYCYKCPKLESLEGAPKEVQLNFNCEHCSKLTSLKGAPKKVGGYFNCEKCPKLHSLDGIGKVEGEIFSDIK